ncbi:unnamed protein product [Ambrosiozyma monospora]|uniref:Unnamed protein product n=1 Tax=Ambrosiozyma monospora TaxID=43982 RepID=A0ACB5UCT5_AMBMO|nr:unnamed protein product [Ambrosiozyma monospora]
MDFGEDGYGSGRPTKRKRPWSPQDTTASISSNYFTNGTTNGAGRNASITSTTNTSVCTPPVSSGLSGLNKRDPSISATAGSGSGVGFPGSGVNGGQAGSNFNLGSISPMTTQSQSQSQSDNVQQVSHQQHLLV